jgi:hypothetical protein
MKQLINKRTIGHKYYVSTGLNNDSENIKFVETPEYRTKGESIIIVRNTPTSKIVLDSTTTTYIKIKALTNVVIIPLIGRIDEEYDEILINKGACVEFFNIMGNWYILSSDGLKLE